MLKCIYAFMQWSGTILSVYMDTYDSFKLKQSVFIGYIVLSKILKLKAFQNILTLRVLSILSIYTIV